MGIGLFGEQLALPLVIACCSSYIWTGHRGIYLSQQVGTPKTEDPAAIADMTLGSARSLAPHRSWFRDLFRLFVEKAPPKPPHEPHMHPSQNGDSRMKKSSRMATHKLGLVRIYLKTQEHAPGGGWLKRLSGRPLFQEIIDQAHAAGLKGATAKLLHYGYSNHGEAKASYHPEAGHVGQNVYIELIDTRERLEAFVAEIAPKVADRVILFKEIEFWNPVPTETHIADEVALLEEEADILPGDALPSEE
jgi:PII-like signaling protein